jgi:hypothetical protein
MTSSNVTILHIDVGLCNKPFVLNGIVNLNFVEHDEGFWDRLHNYYVISMKTLLLWYNQIFFDEWYEYLEKVVKLLKEL